MYNKWAVAHGMTVEVLDYQDGDEAGLKSASMMVKGANEMCIRDRAAALRLYAACLFRQQFIIASPAASVKPLDEKSAEKNPLLFCHKMCIRDRYGTGWCP